MTQAGAESRANYLLKWEAIRSSKEAGATSYDLWGLAHAGIAHFKTGFGGREIGYVGAWDLVLDPFGRTTYQVAQRARVRVERLRHGLRGGGRRPPGRRRRWRRRAAGQRPASRTGATALGRPDGRDRGRRMTPAVRSSTAGDGAAVDAPGGHVLQSRAWAAHRASGGWQPRFLAAGDVRALALVRPWPLLGGGSAYLPRGPVGPGTPWTGDGSGAVIGEALVAAARYLAERRGRRGGRGRRGRGRRRGLPGGARRGGLPRHPGDPAVAAPDVAGAARGRRRRGRARRGRQVDAPADPAGASATGCVVVRHDARAAELDGFTASPGGGGRRPAPVLRPAPRDRRAARASSWAGVARFVAWWRRALDAGHLVYLEAREGGVDRPGAGRARPLPPWSSPLDGALGRRRGPPSGPPGHDAPPPVAGDPAGPGGAAARRWTWVAWTSRVPGGPRSRASPRSVCTSTSARSGRQWVELAGAQERVASPARYAAGRVTTRLARSMGRGRGGA